MAHSLHSFYMGAKDCMKRHLPIALTLVFVFLLTFAAWRAISPNDSMSSFLPPSPTPPDDTVVVNYDVLNKRLNWEEQRLLRLQQTLAEVQSREASAEEAARQVASLQASLAETQQLLSDREKEEAQLRLESRAARREAESANNEEQMATERKIEALEGALFDLQIQAEQVQAAGGGSRALGDIRARMLEMQKQKRQLEVSAHITGLQSRNEDLAVQQETSDLRVQIRNDRQNLLARRADLATALDYWEKQSASLDNPRREERLRVLQNQVTEQQKAVADLQRRLF
jgi:hypothetical protein